jgi:phenylacetate-CoA ligase
VYNIYGTSETKEIAWECAIGNAHINSDVVLVEILNDRRERVPMGDEGEIVVTLLVNFAMPLVRYATGDRGHLVPTPCPCGLPFPVLGGLTGREVDFVELEGGRRISPYTFSCLLEQIPGLQQYQVVQIDRRSLLVRAVLDPNANAQYLEGHIEAALRDRLGTPLSVSVEFTQRLSPEAGAKFQVVHRYSRDE